MTSADFGIYILTYPGDFHLSLPLVRSLQHVNPGVPIMIIPGEGFDYDNHPFDVPIMPKPKGFWAEIGHQDRDFWAFQGPFETFLYLDSDTICVKSLDALIKRIKSQEGDFFFVQRWVNDQVWHTVVHDPTHPEYEFYRYKVRRMIGKGRLEEFAPDHDFFAHPPFNSGVFASRRLLITDSDVASLNSAERNFHRDVLNKAFTWRRSYLFNNDQGRMNYLVKKLSIPTYDIEPELVWVYGGDSIRVSVEEVQNDATKFHVIHWCGAPRPSPSFFCVRPLFSILAFSWLTIKSKTGGECYPEYRQLLEVPGYSLWRHYFEQSIGPITLGARLHWTWRDMKRIWELFIKLWKIRVKELLRGRSPS
ncbi:MAG: hypothetical protein OET63_10635 [Desulfobacterales bacterium]|nr:hypothetical protein [Desulfobacterales bacterium]